MSLSAPELFKPINIWKHGFPEGFNGATRTKVPVSKSGLLMLGAQVAKSTSFVQADLSVEFTPEELSIDVKVGQGTEPFKGLLLAVWGIPTQPFRHLRANVKREGSDMVELGLEGQLESLPESGIELPFGTVNQMTLLVLGETSLKCFRAV